MKNETIAVWLSCGAASAVAAMQTLLQYGDSCNIRVLNNPVIEEDQDNIRFLKDVEKWLDIEVETVINSKYPDCSAVSIWDDRNYMSGNKGAPCTYELKKVARYKFEADNDIDWHVLGFTANEEKRFCNFQERERRNSLPVLIEAGLTKGDCFKIIQDAGIALPRLYDLGYPNANCIGCVKASSPTYWNHVRKHHPEVFLERCVQSRRIGAKLVRYKGKRIYLDELPKDAIGRPMKDMNFECGIWCKTGSTM